jgi:hypothetical protein
MGNKISSILYSDAHCDGVLIEQYDLPDGNLDKLIENLDTLDKKYPGDNYKKSCLFGDDKKIMRVFDVNLCKCPIHKNINIK